MEFGQIQYDKDKSDAELKAEKKLYKIKSNTLILNKIIGKQIADGEIVNVDLSKYDESALEECDGGDNSSKPTGYGQLDFRNLIKNKKMGVKRTNPQEKPEQIKQTEEKRSTKLNKCPQCDFISQNEIFVNQHMLKAHAGRPNCPFCFIGFKDYSSLRKHVGAVHKEIQANEEK